MTATLPLCCPGTRILPGPFALPLLLGVEKSRGEELAPGQELQSLLSAFLSHSTLVTGNVGGEEKQSLFFSFLSGNIIKRENPSACPCLFFRSIKFPVAPHGAALWFFHLSPQEKASPELRESQLT